MFGQAFIWSFLEQVFTALRLTTHNWRRQMKEISLLYNLIQITKAMYYILISSF